MKINSNKGFTIVELLVVIVVIGILAAVTIVSYTGINKKAIAASLQSDLSNAARQLKLFQVDKGFYPTDNNCTAPTTSMICLKSSSGNTYIYEDDTPQTFTLIGRNVAQNITYSVTQDSAPEYIPPPPIASGGSEAVASGYKTHTFTSNGTLTVIAEGSLVMTIVGAGGGGGGGSYYCNGGSGTNGGLSSVSYGVTSFTSFGGTGGSACPTNGTAGNVNIINGGAFVNIANPIIGGGATGGAGSTDVQCPQCEPDEGGLGGAGGKIQGILSVTSGQVINIIVGSGGAGGIGMDSIPNGDGGNSGSVTFRYLN